MATPNDTSTEFSHWAGTGLLQTAFPTTYASMTGDLNVTVYFQPKRYSVSVEVDGTGEVSISGQQDGYNHFGDVIDLNASAPLGFVFSHWIGYGPDTNDSLTTLTVSQNHNLTAVFVPETFDLNVSVSSSNHGNAYALEDGPFQYAGRYSLLAEANPGYSFTHWSSPTDSTFMLDDANLSITGLTLYESGEFTANFEEIYNELIVNMSIGGHSVSPASGSYSAANLISVDATPLTGYEFYRWNDPSGVLANPFLAQTDANISKELGMVMIEAIFRKKNYLVSIVEGTGGNIVFDQPNGPWEYLGNYGLRATAQPGYVFSAWTGNVSSRNSLVNGTSDSNNSIIVTSDISLTATFEEMDYTISVLSTEGGEVSGSGTYTISAPPTLQALPFAGWEFSHWEANETHLTQLTSDTSPDSLINLAGAPSAMEFTAQFKKITHTLELHAIGEGTINGSRDLSMELPNGTEISLVATPADGWRFERWYDIETATPISPILTVTANENLSFSALFTPKTYNLNLVAGPGGSVSADGVYSFGSDVSINAKPNNGYQFVRWDGGDVSISNSNDKNATVRIPDHDLTLTAVFAPAQILTNIQVIGSGTVSAPGVYSYGETIFLEANATIGHIFDKWEWIDEEGNQVFSSINPLSLNLANTESLNLTNKFSVIAHFSPRPENYIDIEFLSSPVNAGIIFDDPSLRTWDQDAEVWERSLMATANNGYSFIGWVAAPELTFSPSILSKNALISQKEERIVTAKFSTNTYSIKTKHETLDGNINGYGNNFSLRQEVSLSAEPLQNKAFSHWEIIRNHSYKVSSGLSSIIIDSPKIYIDEKESPNLTLIRGHTYEFDVQLEDGSFFFSTSKFNDNAFAEEYLEGITNSRIMEGTLTFTVQDNAPNRLYYHNNKHSYSGNSIKIINKSSSEILPYPNNSEIKLIMDHDIHLEAFFKDLAYSLSVTSNEGGSTNITEANFPVGSTVSLTATPDIHYQFVRWEGDGITEENKYSDLISVTMTNDKHIRAVFAPILYPLNVKTSPELSGIFETSDNKFEFPFGTEVELSIKPNSGYTFTNWSGNVENRNLSTTTVIIGESNEITANLTKTPLNLAIEIISRSVIDLPLANNNAGGIIIAPSSAKEGEDVFIEAKPNQGFLFQGWFDEQGNQLSSAESTYLRFTEDTTISAIFKQKSVTISLSVEDSETGKFKVDELDESHEELSYEVAIGERIKVKAIPETGYEFMKWIIVGSGTQTSGEEVLELDADVSMKITAKFKLITPSLSVIVSPELSGFIPVGIGDKVSPHIIMAQPLEGYTFLQWEGEGIENTTNPTTTIDFFTDTTIRAIFEKDVSLTIIPKLTITPTKGGESTSYIVDEDEQNNQVTYAISTTANDDYQFIRWEGSDAISDKTAQETRITISAATEIRPLFQPKPDKIELTINSINGDGSILERKENESGRTVTFDINATANDGYEFVKWEGSDAIKDKTNQTTSITLSKSETITPIFEKKVLTPTKIEIIIWPREGGKIIAGDDVIAEIDKDIIIEVEAMDGYVFERWVELHGIQNLNDPKTNMIVDSSHLNEATLKIYARFKISNGEEIDDNEFESWFGKKEWFGEYEEKGLGMIEHSQHGNLMVDDYEKQDNEFTFQQNNSLKFSVEKESFKNLLVYSHYSYNYLFLDNSSSKNSDELVVYPIENSEKFDVNSDWWQTDWFGYYHWNFNQENWIYHFSLGWTYYDTSKNAITWLWIANLEDWVWIDRDQSVGEGTYVYSFDQKDWLYLDFRNKRFYSFLHEKWEGFPESY